MKKLPQIDRFETLLTNACEMLETMDLTTADIPPEMLFVYTDTERVLRVASTLNACILRAMKRGRKAA